MKDKILKLCKRLDRFDIDKIETISEIEQSELLPILEQLVEEKKLVLNNNIYSYLKKIEKPKPQIFEHYSKGSIDLIIRCFCSNIPTSQTANIVSSNNNSIAKFYQYFRECIFNRQMEELKNKFFRDPQYSRNRIFFEQEVYFYTYNNIVYISSIILEAETNRFLTAEETKEFKKIYSYISRIISHNQNKYSLHQKIAEGLWRRNKEFEELYFDIKRLIFS